MTNISQRTAVGDRIWLICGFYVCTGAVRRTESDGTPSTVFSFQPDAPRPSAKRKPLPVADRVLDMLEDRGLAAGTANGRAKLAQGAAPTPTHLWPTMTLDAVRTAAAA